MTHKTPLAALKRTSPEEWCYTCHGNGEIITNWDRYLDPLEGDVGDESVAPCPDCDGKGECPPPIPERFRAVIERTVWSEAIHGHGAEALGRFVLQNRDELSELVSAVRVELWNAKYRIAQLEEQLKKAGAGA